VHLDGNPIRSCSFPVEAATSGKITTIEGLQGNVARAVVEAWREKDVVQCGYCQSAQCLSLRDLCANPRRGASRC
jgi:isoquinoline 1-oxidoreductase alpha subunit